MSDIQTADGHDTHGRFVRGNNEYSARKRRVAERLAELKADYGVTNAQFQLLAVVARCLDDSERARTLTGRVKAANTARRLLAAIPRRDPPPPTLESYLKRKRDEAAS